MEVILAENAGFCFGVKRAINLAFKAAKHNKKAVYTLGPIIHNQQVVKKLEEAGVKVIEGFNGERLLPEIKRLKSATIIIRTHGVSPKIMDILKSNKLEIIDATCPIVGKSQKIVKSLYDEGYKVVIVGEKEHPEIKSIKGFANDEVLVVNSTEEAERIPKLSKIGLVAQTTLSFIHFQEVVLCMLDKATEFKIYNTICTATAKAQNKALKLSREVDIMIVVGGKNSANTRHLAEICSKEIETNHIEDVTELRKEWFNGKKKVGITAGASTPDWVINEVVHKINKF